MTKYFVVIFIYSEEHFYQFLSNCDYFFVIFYCFHVIYLLNVVNIMRRFDFEDVMSILRWTFLFVWGIENVVRSLDFFDRHETKECYESFRVSWAIYKIIIFLKRHETFLDENFSDLKRRRSKWLIRVMIMSYFERHETLRTSWGFWNFMRCHKFKDKNFVDDFIFNMKILSRFLF